MQDFINSEIYNKIISKEKVIGAYISGSRLFGYNDESSDCDIIFYTNGNVEEEARPNIRINGVFYHWYYVDVDIFKTKPKGKGWEYINFLFLEKIRNHLLYSTSELLNIIDDVLTNKDYRKIGYVYLYEYYYDYITTFISGDNLQIFKPHPHLIMSYYIYTNQELDKDYIMRIKRYRPTKEDLERVKTDLTSGLSLYNSIK